MKGRNVMRHRYSVRKQVSGYSGSESFFVYDKDRKARVSVHAMSREQANASADDLNIGAMVRPHAEDSRPYTVRRAEAEKIYRRNGEADCESCEGSGTEG